MDVTRFVILEHDHPVLHWDLMLEQPECLWTWRLSEPPEHSQTTNAKRIADHRKAYLEYEGPISGNRGSVTRWDAGTYAITQGNPLTIVLNGDRVSGQLRIELDEASFERSA
ncbi:MAG: DNA polymerase ligase N-terminal domain-containing protein [Planctomycetaceae bacterium]